jgi:hypothetical protein
MNENPISGQEDEPIQVVLRGSYYHHARLAGQVEPPRKIRMDLSSYDAYASFFNKIPTITKRSVSRIVAEIDAIRF